MAKLVERLVRARLMYVIEKWNLLRPEQAGYRAARCVEEHCVRLTQYVHDGLVPMQGPNYALAKSIQMWRGTLARFRDGLRVSSNTAPPALIWASVTSCARCAASLRRRRHAACANVRAAAPSSSPAS